MTEIQVKAAVRQRDGYRCVKCGMTNEEHKAARGRSLDVHRKKPGSCYTVKGCITVCIPCHWKEHKRTDTETFTISVPPDIHDGIQNRIEELNRKYGIRVRHREVLLGMIVTHLREEGFLEGSETN